MKCWSSALITGELQLKLIFMSEEEGGGINLRVLKMDEALNLCGRMERRCLRAVDGIAGAGERQVISPSPLLCVDAPSSASPSQCVGTRAAKLQRGLIDFMPSSHIFSHIRSDSLPSSRLFIYLFIYFPGPYLAAAAHLGNRQLSRK